MAILYRVANWDQHFENNRTRDMKHMAWVPIPNRHDGDGYTELVDHENGAAHFGAWCAIVQIASKCSVRGTLLRDCRREVRDDRTDLRGGVVPHDSLSLSRITRLPRELFEEVLPRLVQIGWLTSEVVVSSIDTTIPQDGAERPQEGAVIPQATDEERNGTERNGNTPHKPPKGGEPEGFVRFWLSWPRHHRKVGKSKCCRKWKRDGLEGISNKILESLGRCKISPDWTKDSGAYIPQPMSWLNQTPWETDPAEMQSPSPQGDGYGLQLSGDPIPPDDDIRELLATVGGEEAA